MFFQENGYTVRFHHPADGVGYIRHAQLAYREYKRLGWLYEPDTCHNRKIIGDRYDHFACHYLLLYNAQGETIGGFRILHGAVDYMCECEYEGLAKGVCFDRKSIELSRFVIRQDYEKKQLPGTAYPIADLLFKAIYQLYFKTKQVDRMYTATIDIVIQRLGLLGYPIKVLKQKQLKNTDLIQLCSMSWRDFLVQLLTSQPEKLNWFNTPLQTA